MVIIEAIVRIAAVEKYKMLMALRTLPSSFSICLIQAKFGIIINAQQAKRNYTKKDRKKPHIKLSMCSLKCKHYAGQQGFMFVCASAFAIAKCIIRSCEDRLRVFGPVQCAHFISAQKLFDVWSFLYFILWHFSKHQKPPLRLIHSTFTLILGIHRKEVDKNP